MDRKWMCANRLSKEYKDGVQDFIRFAVGHAKDPNSKIVCPCLRDIMAREVSRDIMALRKHWYVSCQNNIYWFVI